MKTIREVLNLLYAKGWQTAQYTQTKDEAVKEALAEIEGRVVPTEEEIHKILIKEINAWSASETIFDCEKRQAQSLHAMLKERIK